MKIDENHCKSRGGSRPKSLTIDGSDISAIDRVSGSIAPSAPPAPAGCLQPGMPCAPVGFQQIWRLRVCLGDRLLLGWPLVLVVSPFWWWVCGSLGSVPPPAGCLQPGVPRAPVGFCSAGLLCMRSRPAAHLVAVLWRSLGSLPSLHPRSLARLAARPGPRSASPTYRAPHDPEGVGGYQHAQTYTCDIPC